MVGLGNLGQFTQFYTPIYSRGHKMAKNIFKNFLRFFHLWFLGPKKGHLPHFGAEKMTQIYYILNLLLVPAFVR